MKTTPIPHLREQGNVLLLTIVVMSLISFLLVTYLTLVKSQNTAIMRSQAWNAAMPIVEAGLEDALAHINLHGSTNLACDGWVHDSMFNTYTMTRFIGESFYVVTITNHIAGQSNNVPEVESKAYVILPLVLASSGQGPFLAQANAPAQGVVYLGRGVRITTGRDPLFVKGMVARESIDMNGNNVTTDSFDSSTPSKSTDGLYDPNKAQDNGDVAVNSSILNSLTVGNANIYGHASTGPGGSATVGPNGGIGPHSWRNAGNNGIHPNYFSSDMNVSFPDVGVPFSGGLTPNGGWVTNVTSLTISTNLTASAATIAYPSSPPSPPAGYVTTNAASSPSFPTGSPGPVTSSTTANTTLTTTKATNGYPAVGTYIGNISSNYVGNGNPANRGWYITYNLITSWSTNYNYPTFSVVQATYQTNSTYTTTYYDYILGSDNYQLTTLNGSVYVSGNAKLYVTTTLNMDALVVEPGSKLNLYSGASSVSLSGNNTLNSDGKASSFAFWGLPTCTSVTFSGNAGFTGTIYAPNAEFRMNGGGNNATDFVGASITRSVTLNGHFNFHYDEALGSFGPERGWIVKSWTEIEPSRIPRATVGSDGTITFQTTSSTGN